MEEIIENNDSLDVDKSTIKTSTDDVISKKSRIVWVDIAKFICIFFVIFTHLEAGSNFVDAFYGPFFLMGFLFCSGYVTKEENFKTYMFKKFKGLFIPWLIFSNFNIFLSLILTFNSHDNIGFEFLQNLMQIRGYNDGIWFVAALFVAYIPFYFISKLSSKSDLAKWLTLGLTFLAFILINIYTEYCPAFSWGSNALPWHIEYIPTACFFMLLGLYFKREWENKINIKNHILFTIIITLTYLILVYTQYYLFKDTLFVIKLPYNIIKQLCGVAFLITISKIIPGFKLLTYIGQNTIIYFALHGKVFSLIQACCKKIIPTIYENILASNILSPLFAVCLVIIVCLILILPTWFINKFLPFIVGRKYKRKEA